jgi:disulfide bond formation protein DsbB
MSLTESGDRWTAAWKPASPGVYGITIQVSGSAPDGTPLEREASLSIQGQPSASQVATSQRLLGAVGLLLLAVAVVLLLVAVVAVLVLSLLVKRRKRKAGVKNAAAR